MAVENIGPRPEPKPAGGARPAQRPKPTDPVSRDRKREEEARRRRSPREDEPDESPSEESGEEGKGGRVNIRI